MVQETRGESLLGPRKECLISQHLNQALKSECGVGDISRNISVSEEWLEDTERSSSE